MRTIPTVAVLSSSPALASLLFATLQETREWRVRRFTRTPDLFAFLDVAPLDLLVCDYVLEDSTASSVANRIRHGAAGAASSIQIIALTRVLSPEIQRACAQAGVDEVIAKPMSPLYLHARVAARLEAGAGHHIATRSGYRGPERRGRFPALAEAGPERRLDNVVSLLAYTTRRQARPDHA